jgi:hypothetical protein
VIQRFLAFLRNIFRRPVVRWEDGERVTDPRYARLYAETVERIRAVRPDAIQSPDFRVTVRLYDRFPAESAGLNGRVLAPNVINGDTGGTLCLLRAFRKSDGLFTHECRHAITGISDHPSWLFTSLLNT